MKITVAVDAAGRIVGYAHAAGKTEEPLPHAAGKKISKLKPETALATDDGQSVHAIELSSELERHYGKDTFAAELFAHVVSKKGSAHTLERAKK